MFNISIFINSSIVFVDYMSINPSNMTWWETCLGGARILIIHPLKTSLKGGKTLLLQCSLTYIPC